MKIRDIQIKVDFAHGFRLPQIHLYNKKKKEIPRRVFREEYEENKSVLQRVLEISGIH